ncbi:hypothetical protein [Azorhizobium doebereinerae]|uniref:hypothetical protein n=1 Tax=Azorhizobium doebereinerae TaxID=281091 RepID=UPI00040EFC47|nr:hypothetical protein [Azorhizobium doebereinerae]
MAILARFDRAARILRLGLAAALSAAPVCALAAGPDYSGAAGAVFLPFLNAPLAGQPATRTPKLAIAFPGGQAHRGTLDTGSTGVVVSATSIPNFDQLPRLGPGQLTYSSSGRIEKGVWVVTPLTLSGGNGASVTTRPMPVLAVNEIACTASARNCRPRRNPKGIAMFGIGFARQHDHQAQGTPDHNPLLNVEGMGTPEQLGRMRRGYVVSRRGVLVGLDAASTAGFSFVKLDKSPVYPDWSAAPVCISVAGTAPPACGTMLMDTGVTTMYLRVPPEQLAGHTAPNAKGLPVLNPGTSVALTMTGAQGIGYSFNVGDRANPLAPLDVVLVHADANPGPFVNTSVRFLNGFDYLYDADAGYVGFRALNAR